MSGVYEKYHSEINRDHIMSIVSNILNTEYGIVLSDIDGSKKDFQSQLIKTFSTQKSDDLVSLNKSLIDSFISYAKDNYQKTDVQNKLSELLKQRNTIFENKEETIISPIKGENDIKNTQQNKQKQPYKHAYGPITINSVKRSSIQSSRYNYTYDLDKHKIKPEDLNSIIKIIIPIDETYIFSHPILYLSIIEFDYNIYLQKTGEINNGHRKYGIYEPNQKNTINTNTENHISKISIDIRDISETKYAGSDILKANQLNITDNQLCLSCSNIRDHDFKEGDVIKFININLKKYKRLFTHPLKIQSIEENKLYCDMDEDCEDMEDDSLDMKIMNVSNQNIIYFNSVQ